MIVMAASSEPPSTGKSKRTVIRTSKTTAFIALRIKVFSATFRREIVGTKEVYCFIVTRHSESYDYIKEAMRRLYWHPSRTETATATLSDGSIMIIVGTFPGSTDETRNKNALDWLDKFGKGERWVTVTRPAKGCLVALQVDGIPFRDTASYVLRKTRFSHDEKARKVVPVPFDELTKVGTFSPFEFSRSARLPSRESSVSVESSDSDAEPTRPFKGSLASRFRKLFLG